MPNCDRCGKPANPPAECGIAHAAGCSTICELCHDISHDELGVPNMIWEIQHGDPDGVLYAFLEEQIPRSLIFTPIFAAQILNSCLFFFNEYNAKPRTFSHWKIPPKRVGMSHADS